MSGLSGGCLTFGEAGLACSKNLIPFDLVPPAVAPGLRLSSTAGTTRGFGPAKFEEVGRWIGEVLDALAQGADQAAEAEARVREEVPTLCKRLPIYPDL